MSATITTAKPHLQLVRDQPRATPPVTRPSMAPSGEATKLRQEVSATNSTVADGLTLVRRGTVLGRGANELQPGMDAQSVLAWLDHHGRALAKVIAPSYEAMNDLKEAVVTAGEVLDEASVDRPEVRAALHAKAKRRKRETVVAGTSSGSWWQRQMADYILGSDLLCAG